MIELRAGSVTDVGRVRTTNQDDLLVMEGLFAVADGMGGAAAGEVASSTAIAALREAFAGADRSADGLAAAAEAANRAVWDRAEANPEMRGMGTTLVAVAPVDDGSLAVANVGDSRLYLFRGGELRQVTKDHSLVAELVDEGRLSPEEAESHPRRNIMTRALGVDAVVPVDLFRLEPHAGDRLLLCSDGLPRELPDDFIASMLTRLVDPQDAARELVEEAKGRGGNDNITVIVVDVIVDGAGPDPSATGSNHAGTSGPAGPDGLAAPPGGDDRPDDATRLQPAVGPGAAEPPGRPDPDAAPAPAPAPTRRWRPWRRRPKPDPRPRARVVTIRVVGFVIAVVALLAAAAAGIGWYARGGYFVGLRGDRITIFQGRPGGLLWFAPTVAAATPHTTAQVEPRHLPELQAGQQEPSLDAARRYVDGLLAEQQAARAAGGGGSPAGDGPSSTTVAGGTAS